MVIIFLSLTTCWSALSFFRTLKHEELSQMFFQCQVARYQNDTPWRLGRRAVSCLQLCASPGTERGATPKQRPHTAVPPPAHPSIQDVASWVLHHYDPFLKLMTHSLTMAIGFPYFAVILFKQIPENSFQWDLYGTERNASCYNNEHHYFNFSFSSRFALTAVSHFLETCVT